jgi:uncharacterized repeat protein (TIGR02543 family)
LAFTGASVVSANITVYAQWTGKTYTVTFMRNYAPDTALFTKTVTVPATTIADFPADPSRSGYNFAGWNTQSDGAGTAFSQSTRVHGNITVYALWAHDQFTITLDLDAGSGAFSQTSFTIFKGGSPGSQTLSVNGSGYTNPRWLVDGNLKATTASIVISAADYGAGPHTLTLMITKGGVSWSKELPFTVDAGTLREVIFRLNDGTGTVYASRTATAGGVVNPFPAPPARGGYDFSGWNTSSGGGGSAFTGASVVSADTTVYAVWTPKTYTVTFMSNYAPDTALFTKSVTVPATTLPDFPADPSRSGYNFAGWNTQSNGAGMAFGQNTKVYGDITVYALWAHEQFAITLHLDAGLDAFSQTTFTLSKGGGESQTVSVSGSGYTDPRWLVDGNLVGTADSVVIRAADYGAGPHNLTLIAKKSGVSWSKELPFTITN